MTELKFWPDYCDLCRGKCRHEADSKKKGIKPSCDYCRGQCKHEIEAERMKFNKSIQYHLKSIRKFLKPLYSSKIKEDR